MNIEQIFSRRRNRGQNYAQPIIYEWEDDLSRELNAPVTPIPIFYKIINRLKIHSAFLAPNKDTFRFVINGRDQDEPMNSKHIIPCIIDFFEKDDTLFDFYQKHSENKIILVSSPFDYQYLKEKGCPLNVGLFAYSLSDRYAITNNREKKKYDIVLTGRQDPLLYSFFKKYVQNHPNVTYVKRGEGLENDNQKTKAYYLNGKEYIGAIESRKDFIKLQAQGRVTLYGVQGYDENTKDFFHMTPHFLEIIACSNHVLARYPFGRDGIDAEYYEFDKFSPSIETYEEFEHRMDIALSTEVDLEAYSAYLQKHYTSTRVKELKKLLADL
jgi:hypothetical protein